jgi:hypothetical protein
MNKFAKIIEYLFYLFLFLLPWQTQWIWHQGKLGELASPYLTFSLYGTEILLAVILLLAIIYKFLLRDWEIAFLNLKVLDFYILLLAFLIMAVVSVFFSADKNVALYYLLRLAEGFGLLLLVINFKFSYLNTAGVLVMSGLVQAGLGISQVLTQKVWGNKWLGMAEQLPQTPGVSVIENGTMRFLRAYGSLSHPNILGGFLVICLILLIILIIFSRHKWEKVLLWVSLPVILSGLFLTFSKSAFLALLVSMVFLITFIILSRDSHAKQILSQIIIVSIATVSLLVIIFSGPLMTRWQGESRTEIYSQENRAMYLEQAKNLITQNLLTGVGLGNYTLAVYDQSEKGLGDYAYQPVHNVYLMVVSELGIIGFIIFILIIIEAIRRIWTYKIDEHINLLGVFKLFKFKGVYDFYQEKYFWFLATTAILIAVLVLMVFDHYFWTLYFGIMLWWLSWGLFVKTIGWVK